MSASKISSTARKSARRRARALSLQILYELDCTTHDLDEVVVNHINASKLPREMFGFVNELVRGTVAVRHVLDDFIHEHAPEWPFDQMAIIDRNILRMAIWEVALHEDTPTKVAINEAVELAKRFGADSTPAFINGVLGSLALQKTALQQALRDNPAPTETT